MRDTFVKALIGIARQDKNVMLLTGDLGFGVLTKFAQEFPDQYLNVGVAEQNLTGLATGLSLEGKIVYTYSIGNFPTLRCLEQIRNDVCYHNANVKIVSIGGGFCYGPLGISHHATEDLAIMRVLPNLTVFAPGDLYETEKITVAAYNLSGPCYLRLGRGGEARIHSNETEFCVGKAICLSKGRDVALLSTGGILPNMISARNMLQKQGIESGVYSIHTLKPFDEGLIKLLAQEVRLIVTIEEHSIIGGLGGAVAETLAEIPDNKCPLMRIGLMDTFSSVVGDQTYLREVYGLNPEAIVNKIGAFFSSHN